MLLIMALGELRYTGRANCRDWRPYHRPERIISYCEDEQAFDRFLVELAAANSFRSACMDDCDVLCIGPFHKLIAGKL